MIYTIISRIPMITSDSSSRRYFKIFLFGSLVYILLHYYLHAQERWEILEKLKGYLYYIMVIDFLIACAWAKFSGSSDDTDTEENETHRGQKFTNEEQDEIERNMQELRRMQMMKQQALMASDTGNNQNALFVKRNEAVHNIQEEPTKVRNSEREERHFRERDSPVRSRQSNDRHRHRSRKTESTKSERSSRRDTRSRESKHSFQREETEDRYELKEISDTELPVYRKN